MALWILAAPLFAPDAHAAGPKRVLVLHSFGRDVAPWNTTASVFRTDIARRSPVPISLFEASLDFGRTVSEDEGLALLAYLKARFADAPPDAVVTIGTPAARFYLKHRSDLFPESPLVVAALDERFARTMSLSGKDSVVAINVAIPRLAENILQVLPETQTIAVVFGASGFERVWVDEFKREFARFAGRVNLVWLNDLPLPKLQEYVAKLPPHSAVLYALFIADAAGVPHERLDALGKLRSVARAPIFGLYENELGEGVVGGPYFSQRRQGERMATAALRALDLPAPDQAQFDVMGFEPAVYDARELERWNVDPARLPADAQVRFKVPSMWEEHRVEILATAVLVFVQAALITGLLVQRARRRRAEREAQLLGGRILTAQEDERRRLAREMHDDVTQRLAALAIDAARFQDDVRGSKGAGALETLRERLVDLSEDVHALSYRLHPSVIEDLGLVAALRVECNRVAQQEPIEVKFEHEDVPKKLPPSAAICLFRIAQEALRNVARHANARRVAVSLRGEEGGIALVVRDDGKGFTDSVVDGKASLGLVSMRERVRLVGGKVNIVGRPSEGTSVEAWVPLGEAA